jgi:hypothetical protein
MLHAVLAGAQGAGVDPAAVTSLAAAGRAALLLERVQPYPIRLVNWFMSK